MLRRIIIVFVIVIGLGSGIYFISKTPPKDPNETPDSTPMPTIETIKLVDKSRDDLDKIEISNSLGTFSLIKQTSQAPEGSDTEEALEAAPEATPEATPEPQWICAEIPSAQLDASKITSLLSSLANITADQKVEGTGDQLEAFGLAEPSAKVVMDFNDGERAEILLGGQTLQKYYAKKADDDVVYAISSYTAEKFNTSLKDLRNLKVMTAPADMIREVKLDGSGGVVFHAQYDNANQDYMTSWKMLTPFQRPVRDEEFKAQIVDVIAEVDAVDVIDIDNSAQLDQYGLQPPLYTLTCGYDQEDKTGEEGQAGEMIRKQVSMRIGNIDGQKIYALKEGDGAVYVLPADKYDLSKIDAFSFVNAYGALVNIDTVDNIEITAGDESYIMKIIRDGENESYKLNDKDIEESPFKALYRELIGMGFDAVATGIPSQDQLVLSVKFNRIDLEPVVMEYFIYDDRNVSLFEDGQCTFIVRKKTVDGVVEKLKEANVE